MLLMTVSIAMHAQSGIPAPPLKIVERNLAFPFPVQWTSNGVEVSLTHVAWGPADSPEIQSKGRERTVQERPAFYPERPHVLALGFQARMADVVPTISYTVSGLVRITDSDGNIEIPRVLTPEGFVPFSGSPGVFDIHFDKNTTTEFWDFFPANSHEHEFLFAVFSGNSEATDRRTSFKIILRDGAIDIADVSPHASTCLDLNRVFTGTIGASTRVRINLAGHDDSISGTEEYERIGKVLWLRGNSDALGNIVLKERYPEDQVTGVFKGKFSSDCQSVRGYFSKPDGSQLLPFEFRQVTRSDGN